MTATIALLTDFGTSDSYVATMKAVMLGINPDSRFIDITHAIAPQNVQHGAFTLLNCYRYFPPGTIFLVVVDPGVGSIRKPIAVQAGDYFFVAPDNGVLSYVLADYENTTVVELGNPLYQQRRVSNTFHGRDIFAPAAAPLAFGVAIHNFGATVEQPHKVTFPKIKIETAEITGEILYADHFGNIITNIGAFTWLDSQRLQLAPRFNEGDKTVIIKGETASLKVKDVIISKICRTYAEVARNEMLVLVGSSGFLEIAVNQGSAARQLVVSPGDSVTLQIG